MSGSARTATGDGAPQSTAADAEDATASVTVGSVTRPGDPRCGGTSCGGASARSGAGSRTQRDQTRDEGPSSRTAQRRPTKKSTKRGGDREGGWLENGPLGGVIAVVGAAFLLTILGVSWAGMGWWFGQNPFEQNRVDTVQPVPDIAPGADSDTLDEIRRDWSFLYIEQAPSVLELMQMTFAITTTLGGAAFLVISYRKSERERREEARVKANDGIEHQRAGRSEEREKDQAFTDHYGSAADQIASGDVAKQLAGLYAMASLARTHVPRGYAGDAESRRKAQQCIDMVCAFVRLTDIPAATTTPVGGTRSGAATAHTEAEVRKIRSAQQTALDLLFDLLPEPSDNIRHETAVAYTFNLTGADLAGLDFGGHQWTRRGDAARVILAEANLNGTNMQAANLNRADLTDANLTRASLIYAQLNQATLTRCVMTQTNLSDASARQASFHQACLTGAFLTYGTFTDAALGHVDLTGATLVAADLTGADLAHARLDRADLTRAVLQGATLEYARLHSAAARRASLAGANLTRADVIGADFTETNLVGAQFVFTECCWLFPGAMGVTVGEVAGPQPWTHSGVTRHTRSWAAAHHVADDEAGRLATLLADVCTRPEAPTPVTSLARATAPQFADATALPGVFADVEHRDQLDTSGVTWLDAPPQQQVPIRTVLTAPDSR